MIRLKRGTIRTRRLEIRPLRLADYESWAWIQINGKPACTRYDRGPLKAADCTRAKFRRLISRQKRLARIDRCYVWAVFERRTGNLVGMVDFFVICREVYQMANLGYRIYNLYWERGFGREAVLAAMKMVFRDLRLHRLEAAIDPDNLRSIALARSLGMRDEGIRQSYYFQDGGWSDQRVFSMTPEMLRLRARPPVF